MRLLTFTLLIFYGSAFAQNYKCIENGKILLTDQPCRTTNSTAPRRDVEKTAAQIQKEFEQDLEKKKSLKAAEIEEIKRVEREKEIKDRSRKAAVADGPRRAEIGALTLRASMRDPDSFRLEAARVVSDSGTVCYVYRSKNGFGGYTSGLAILLSDTFELVLSDKSGFHDLWHKECHMKEGNDFSAAIRLLTL